MLLGKNNYQIEVAILVYIYLQYLTLVHLITVSQIR